MNNKVIGAIFCLISAILMCTRYLYAAIFMSGVASWSADLFSAGLAYVGSPLKAASVVALIIGILFLGYGIYQGIRKPDKKS